MLSKLNTYKQKFITIAVMVVAVLTPIHAQASCEREQAEYDRFRGLCDKTSGCSQALAFTIIGGIACGAAAKNQCRIRDEKLSNLQRCKQRVADEAAAAARAAMARAEEAGRIAREKAAEAERNRLESERQAKRLAAAQAVNEDFRQRADTLRAAAQKTLEDYIASLERESTDIANAESVVAKKKQLDEKLAKDLEKLEVDRKEALGKI